jgi:hypothetical protein
MCFQIVAETELLISVLWMLVALLYSTGHAVSISYLLSG